MTEKLLTDKELHSLAMGKLKSKFVKVNDSIGAGSKLVYIDYPAHFNTGDLLINIGTEAFFNEYHVAISERYAIGDLGKYDGDADAFRLGRRIRSLDSAVEKGAVLGFHGGGSFGDIWPHHQRMREALLTRYPGVRAIVFPQSVQFQQQKRFDEAAKLFGSNRNITLFVRDQESLAFVNASGVAGEALPDMAHQLWNDKLFFPYSYAEGAGELHQCRVDLEGANPAGFRPGFDWSDTQTNVDRAAYIAFSAWRRSNPIPSIAPSYKLWYLLRNRIIHRGISEFQKFNTVRTDRLHGVILSALLMKYVSFDDRSNRYRKLHRYYSNWLTESPMISSD